MLGAQLAFHVERFPMTDTSNPTPPQDPAQADTPPDANAQPATGPSLRVLGQYVKDLSFENPGNVQVNTQPNIDLGIDVGATPHVQGDGMYEVSLKLNAKAQAEDKVLFITELEYAGLFKLENVSETDLEPMLLIECPRLLFPFARRIIAELTREGGFPPLLIDPVDFVSLYKSQKAQAQQAAAAPADPAPQTEN